MINSKKLLGCLVVGSLLLTGCPEKKEESNSLLEAPERPALIIREKVKGDYGFQSVIPREFELKDLKTISDYNERNKIPVIPAIKNGILFGYYHKVRKPSNLL